MVESNNDEADQPAGVSDLRQMSHHLAVDGQHIKKAAVSRQRTQNRHELPNDSPRAGKDNCGYQRASTFKGKQSSERGFSQSSAYLRAKDRRENKFADQILLIRSNRKASRNSSMFKDSSDRGDGLSMNFAVGQSYFNKKRRSDDNMQDLASHSVSEFVAGGDKAPPFVEKDRFKRRPKYATSSDRKLLYTSETKPNRLHELSKAKLLARSRNHSFDLDADLEEDITLKLKKANKKMKDIYLSKPYQVLTFAQVNKRQADNTPTRVYSVYRADQHL